MTRKRRKPNALEDLKQKLQENELFKDRAIITNMPGKKLSAALLEFIAPFDDPTLDKAAYGKLVAMAVVAWDAAILKGKERKELVDATMNEIEESAGKPWRKEAEKHLAMMIKRKEQFFADDKRLIIEYSVVETKTHRHVAVSTILESADNEMPQD